jgi:hypothetical protein
MNPWLRRILVAFVLGVALILFLISRLPSSREIARKMSEPAPALSGVPTVEASPLPGAPQSPVPMPSGSAIHAPSPSASPLAPAAKRAQNAHEMKLITAMLDEDPRDIRVCDHLGNSKPDSVSRLSNKDNPYTVDELFGQERTDPLLEAYRVPLRAIFQEPSVADLLREVNGYDTEGLDGKSESDRESFLGKVGFYARVARASANLVANKGTYEKLGDRANHLTVLAKLAIEQPKLRDDARVMDFCRKIQNDPNPPTSEALHAERTELLGLIADLGMKPKDVDFDPEDWTKFALKQTGNSLSISLSGKDGPK